MSVETQPASLPAFDAERTHFERLGLEPKAEGFERELLERNYIENSTWAHPDRFVLADVATQRRAVEHASAINEAYRVLRDPLRRAEYLVKLGGIDLDSSDEQGGAPKPDQAFLIEMIERREGLEEAARKGADALESLGDEVEDEQGRELDLAYAALRDRDVGAAAKALVTCRYLARLSEEIRRLIEGGQEE